MCEVINIRTRKVLFTDSVRANIEKGLSPYVEIDAAAAATDAVEKVLCTAIVGYTADLATKLATKLFNKFVKPEATENQL